MIGQEFRDAKKFIINDKMVNLFRKVKQETNDTKSAKNKNLTSNNKVQENTSEMVTSKHNEQIEEDIMEDLSEQIRVNLEIKEQNDVESVNEKRTFEDRSDNEEGLSGDNLRPVQKNKKKDYLS